MFVYSMALLLHFSDPSLGLPGLKQETRQQCRKYQQPHKRTLEGLSGYLRSFSSSSRCDGREHATERWFIIAMALEGRTGDA